MPVVFLGNQPAVEVGRIKDHWHSVMQLGHEGVTFADDDGAALDFTLGAVPTLPEAGER